MREGTIVAARELASETAIHLGLIDAEAVGVVLLRKEEENHDLGLTSPLLLTGLEAVVCRLTLLREVQATIVATRLRLSGS